MTPTDEETLAKHTKIFKKKKKIYEVAAYILKCLNLEDDWQSAMQCYQFYKEQRELEIMKERGLLKIVRVFVLHAALICLKEVYAGNPERALSALQACSICCFQFLMPDDVHYLQVVYYIERICVGVRRSKNCSPQLASFQQWLSFIKTS